MPGLWGPAAREILQPRHADDLSTFPYMRRARVAVGPVPCLAVRVTYVGELGWELYCPMEFGLALWDALWEGGRAAGLVAGGYRAIDSLRLEKGYRAWGADITPDETPDEAGVGFAVSSTTATSSAATRCSPRRGPSAAWPAWCWTTLGRSRSARSRCAWTASWPAG